MKSDLYLRLKGKDHKYLWHPFTQMQEWLDEDPLIIARSEGNYLIDTEGKRYLDGISSLWCNLHGHVQPDISEAISRQLEKVAHSTLLGLSNIPSIQLAEKLIEIAPKGLTRVFYSDAGATAVEVSLKMAFQYWQLKGDKDKIKFASLSDSYHGDTLGAINVGYSELFHHYYRPLLQESLRLTPPHVFRFHKGMSNKNSIAAAKKEARRTIENHHREIAALIVEPLIQGAAGMWTHPIEYLSLLKDLCRRHNILLICDEVATGFGRTGTMFACEQAEIQPDLLCLAKGLTGGYLPLAATLTTEKIFSTFLAPYDEFKTFFHGHTFTGNPLGCAAALASLQIFQEQNVLTKLKPIIKRLKDRLDSDLSRLNHVADIRQQGLMAGIELMLNPEEKIPYAATEKIGIRVILEARKRGVILRPLGDVITLMPPLSIKSTELNRILDVTRDSIEAVTCQAS
jgi:adenosylmethionine-8-amino-7-oxononanoate aminotransferase